jgi:Mini-chromosome maintenance replisome factor
MRCAGWLRMTGSTVDRYALCTSTCTLVITALFAIITLNLCASVTSNWRSRLAANSQRYTVIAGSVESSIAPARVPLAAVVLSITLTLCVCFVYTTCVCTLQTDASITADDFHTWLTIARLTAQCEGAAAVAPHHWKHMKVNCLIKYCTYARVQAWT